MGASACMTFQLVDDLLYLLSHSCPYCRLACLKWNYLHRNWCVCVVFLWKLAILDNKTQVWTRPSAGNHLTQHHTHCIHRCNAFLKCFHLPECRHREEYVPSSWTAGHLPGSAGQVCWPRQRSETSWTRSDKYVTLPYHLLFSEFLKRRITNRLSPLFSVNIIRWLHTFQTDGKLPCDWGDQEYSQLVVILLCAFVWKKSASVTLSVWFSDTFQRFPQTKLWLSLASFFHRHPPPTFTTLISHHWPQALSSCLYLRPTAFLCEQTHVSESSRTKDFLLSF